MHLARGFRWQGQMIRRILAWGLSGIVSVIKNREDLKSWSRRSQLLAELILDLKTAGFDQVADRRIQFRFYPATVLFH